MIPCMLTPVIVLEHTPPAVSPWSEVTTSSFNLQEDGELLLGAGTGVASGLVTFDVSDT